MVRVWVHVVCGRGLVHVSGVRAIGHDLGGLVHELMKKGGTMAI